MLVLSRKVQQQIVIGEDIRITILKVDASRVQLGFEAPRSIDIRRDELPLRHASPPNDKASAPTTGLSKIKRGSK